MSYIILGPSYDDSRVTTIWGCFPFKSWAVVERRNVAKVCKREPSEYRIEEVTDTMFPPVPDVYGDQCLRCRWRLDACQCNHEKKS